MGKRKRIILIIVLIPVVAIVLAAIFISPIAKYLIEKNSVEYTGRKITLQSLSINIFSGNIHAEGLKIYEQKSDQTFFECAEIETGISIRKLFSSSYDITHLTITRPVVKIIQKGTHFNYDDLIKKFASDTTAKPAAKNTPPVQYWVQGFNIDTATIIYTNNKPLTKLRIIKANLSIPRIAWDDPQYLVHTDFSLESGGAFKAEMRLNKTTLAYSVKAEMREFSIDWLYPYLKDYMKVKSLKGIIGSSMYITGNMNKPTDIAASGNLTAGKFSIVDETNELLTAIDLLSVEIDTLNTAKNMYNFTSIDVSRPFIRVSMYDKGFNYQRIMTTPFANSGDTSSVVYSNIFLMMAGYIQAIVKEYDVNNYKINRLNVSGGQCIFTDFTHGDRFRYILDSIRLTSDRINSQNPKLVFNVMSRLNTSGKMKGSLSVNPQNYKDIHIDAKITDLLMTDFNPYSKYYVATPFLNGKISYINTTSVVHNNLDSKNVLDIIKLTAGKKVKNKTAMNLPVPLAVSLLKDVKGNVHLDIPVKGSLDDPKFKWGKIVWQVLKNLIIKAATAPFRMLANLFGGKEEDFKEVPFDYVQAGIQPSQQKVLDNLARVATEKPELKLELVQVTNRQDEAEAIAVYETKKAYLGITEATPINEAIKKRVDSLQNTDSLFVKYIEAKLKTSSSLESAEEKCVQLVGRDKLEPMVTAVMAERNNVVTDYLMVQKKIPADRLSVINTKEENQLQRSAPPKYIINVATKE